MALLLETGDLTGAAARLSPYTRRMLDTAALLAVRMHAEEVAPEHLLCSLLEDEESGASRAIVHAFADPETLSIEVLALCPGILVTSSDRSLPFSPGGVRLLFAARATAARRGVGAVTAAQLLHAAWSELPPAVASAAVVEAPVGDPDALPVPPSGPLFARFDDDARRVLGLACRLSGRRGHTTIGPAAVALACLEHEAALTRALGLGRVAARELLGDLADPERPPARDLAPDAELTAFLAGVEAPGDSLELLAGFVTVARQEIRQLLGRQKVTPALVERARGVFQDPDEL